MATTSQRLVLASFAVAAISAVIMPDLHYGLFAIVTYMFLTPLVISMLTVSGWIAGIRLWKIVILTLAAFILHFVISMLIYAHSVESFHFDPETYLFFKAEWIFRVVVFIVVLAGGAAYRWRSRRDQYRAL